jgi:hypothetical protein
MGARPLSIARATVPLVFLFQLFAAFAHAQAPPVRDRVPAPPPGTAVIKGRVVDAQTGNALARARVRLQAPGNPAPVLTDETGAFKITGAPAGSVYLWVERTGYMATTYPQAKKTIRSSIRQLMIEDGQVLDGVKIPLDRGGAIVGHVVDAHGEPAESVTIQVYRVSPSVRSRPQQRGATTTNDLGEFRVARLEAGSYLLRATGRNSTAGDDPSDTQSLPVYYPGVPSMEQAQPITVERGQTAAGIEIMLVEATSSVVSGTVLDAKGQPPNQGAYVSARQSTAYSDFVVGGAAVRPDGTFRMKLLPGDYTLEVQAVRPDASGVAGPADHQYGRARISVGAAPISDVAIVLAKGASIAGRVAFDGDSPPPANLQQISVGLGPPPMGIGCQIQGGSGALKPDGTFQLQAVVGACIVRVMGNLGRWSVKSIVQGEADLQDRVVTFDPGQQLRDVLVVLTDKRTELKVTVNDEHGQPTRDYVAIAFSTDKSKWNEISPYVRILVPRPPSRSQAEASLRGAGDLRAASVSTQRDTIANAPAGEYYVVAVSDIAAEDTRDPEVLERLSAGATRVVISHERSPVEVTLRRTDPR